MRYFVRMLRRAFLALAALYMAAALIGHAQERRGAVTCDCADSCWCKRPGLRFFRWTFPVGHSPR